MVDFIKTQNSFVRGEVAPEFYACDNMEGLSKLENLDITAGGGLSRRWGLKFIRDINSDARLVPFSVGEEENYLLVIKSGHIYIFNKDERVKDLASPWGLKDLPKLQYAQRFGTMIFVHPDYPPRILEKVGEDFRLFLFDFERNDSNMDIGIPFMKFDDARDIKITVSADNAGNNYALFTTNQNFWTPENVGGRLLLLGKQWFIEEYINAKNVRVFINGTYSLPSGPISDWYEAAFSDRRGWPCSITFHQDRLVFGGSKSYPSGVWLSKVGHHRNFNVGTGLDDEAIFITLLSEQRQQICTVVSSDNLQILTSVGEWAISSKPLTPAVVNIKQHTSVGSVATRYLPPQKIEGATVFISASKQDIRELTLDELGENYSAKDLCALSKHLMKNPIDLAYNELTKQLFIVMEDGDMAVLNQNSALGVSAWGNYRTQGKFRAVAVVDGETFVMVQREERYCLEKFSKDATLDCDEYGFSFKAAALPLRASGHNAKKFRIRKITARVLNTKALLINGITARFPNKIYAPTSNGYSGDVSINLLGNQRDCIKAPWIIQSSEPFPATILSITIYGSYQI